MSADPNERWLDLDPQQDEPPIEQPSADLVPVADAELVGPDLFPHNDEWERLCVMAATLANASLVPRPLQGRPADVLLILLTARSLGIDPTAAIRLCHVIDGKVTVAPKMRLALLNLTGKGRIVPTAVSATSVTAAVYRGDQLVETRTLDMTEVPADLRRKNNWRDYPQRMLWWRISGWLLDDHFPEVGSGLYSPDELGAVTDADGEPITVESVEPAFVDRKPAAPKPANPELVAGLQTRLGLLKPPEGVEDNWRPEWESLRTAVLDDWKQQIGTTPEGYGLPPDRLDHQQAQRAAALLRRWSTDIDELWAAWRDATGNDAEIVDAEIVTEDDDPERPFTEDGYYE